MKRKAYQQNPTVIDTLKKARPPPEEITPHKYVPTIYSCKSLTDSISCATLPL